MTTLDDLYVHAHNARVAAQQELAAALALVAIYQVCHDGYLGIPCVCCLAHRQLAEGKVDATQQCETPESIGRAVFEATQAEAERHYREIRIKFTIPTWDDAAPSTRESYTNIGARVLQYIEQSPCL